MCVHRLLFALCVVWSAVSSLPLWCLVHDSALAGAVVGVHARPSQLGAGAARWGSGAGNPCELVMSWVELWAGSDSHPEINVLQGWA